ncbi:MAG: 3-oxoacyl-ACP synthase [Flavobacteriaceae bacterium]
MRKPFFISDYVSIRKNSLSLNGETIFSDAQETSFKDFSKNLYKHIEMNYPKFYKMDNLSKLALLATETLFKNKNFIPEQEEIALLLSNKSSSLDTDLKHQESIADENHFFPSPAVFVYTLANICLGEISIKYKLQTENAFFVFESFQPDFMTVYAEQLLQTGKAKKVLCGWVEYTEDSYEAFIYLVDEQGVLENRSETLKKLYLE